MSFRARACGAAAIVTALLLLSATGCKKEDPTLEAAPPPAANATAPTNMGGQKQAPTFGPRGGGGAMAKPAGAVAQP